LEAAFEKLGNDFKNSLPDANKAMKLKEAYLNLLKIDGSYVGSTFYKLEERDHILWTWTHDTAFFYAFTLYTTIGFDAVLSYHRTKVSVDTS
ncbi:hypothetical protein PMAYCL1PPCAC_15726, partial [Pristionchus mayeri]